MLGRPLVHQHGLAAAGGRRDHRHRLLHSLPQATNEPGAEEPRWVFARSGWNTWTLRRGGRFAVVHEVVRGRRHIHHFVPGIVAAFVAGGGALVMDGRHREWLAVPFGAGVALTLDEWALLLELSDVYWSEEGIVSLQATLGTTAVLATLMLALRLLRRGERTVLPAGLRWRHAG